MSAPLYKELFASVLRENYFRVGLAIILALAIFAIIGPYTAKYHNPFSPVGPPGSPPDANYWLGTTIYGQDVYTQMVYGLKNTLYIGALAGLIATAIGVTIGVIAGYFGGKTDIVLNFLTNAVLTMPVAVVVLLIAVSIPRSWITTTLLGVLIGAFSWPWSARAVRAIAMSIREREFILVAKLSGESPVEIAFTEVLPQMLAYVFLVYVLQFSGALIADLGLEGLGLLPYNTMTIGYMLFWAVSMSAAYYGYWWWFFPPGLLVMLAATSLAMIAMAMDKAFNPRLREE